MLIFPLFIHDTEKQNPRPFLLSWLSDNFFMECPMSVEWLSRLEVDGGQNELQLGLVIHQSS